MIGYSLSLCVTDICQGRVSEKDVDTIIASTAADTEGDWGRLLNDYCATYWKEFPVMARHVVKRLRAANKIKQPRLDDPSYYRSNVGGWWE